MDNKINVPPALIKVGEKKNLLKLQKEGQVYFGTFSGYRLQEKEELKKMLESLFSGQKLDLDQTDFYRRDAYEGREQSIPAEIKIRFLNKEFNNLTIHDSNGRLNIYQNKYKHLYCLYGIPNTPELDFKFDERMLKFGDHALIITKPLVFLERCIEKLSSDFDMRSVEYFTENIGHYNMFQKRTIFEYQREFRIATNIANGNSIFIGNIEDISILVKSESLPNLELGFR